MYEGTKKVKDIKLQMLTTRFEELEMSEDESFDSFYSKLNEVVIGKFNLGEKTEDTKIVGKILRSRGVHGSGWGDFLTQPTMVGKKKFNSTQPIT